MADAPTSILLTLATHYITLTQGQGRQLCAAFATDELFVSGGNDGALHVWDTELPDEDGSPSKYTSLVCRFQLHAFYWVCRT